MPTVRFSDRDDKNRRPSVIPHDASLFTFRGRPKAAYTNQMKGGLTRPVTEGEFYIIFLFASYSRFVRDNEEGDPVRITWSVAKVWRTLAAFRQVREFVQ